MFVETGNPLFSSSPRGATCRPLGLERNGGIQDGYKHVAPSELKRGHVISFLSSLKLILVAITFMDIRDLRREIDRIDFELVKLLKTRMEVALKTRKFKRDVMDASREEEVLRRVQAHANAMGLLSPEFTSDLFASIIQESKTLQTQGYFLAGFQGEHGAYSEVAARMYDPSLVYIPCVEFADVFEGVAQGQLDVGIVPVENSLGGAITQVNELLIETDLTIINDVKIPVHHCLLTLPETDYREIRVVYSHPQALTQCRNFLNRNHLEARPYYDTAGAARMLNNERPKAAAAIASELCAEIYDLEIIKETIEDHDENQTRFLVISKQPPAEAGNKCSIIFAAVHRAGALFEILKVFADAHINLTRIESMPNREDPGNYYFFLDFEGNAQDEQVQRVLADVQQHTMMYKFLGCYREVKQA
jgi:prephenate dehydratase/chorismate mutase